MATTQSWALAGQLIFKGPSLREFLLDQNQCENGLYDSSIVDLGLLSLVGRVHTPTNSIAHWRARALELVTLARCLLLLAPRQLRQGGVVELRNSHITTSQSQFDSLKLATFESGFDCKLQTRNESKRERTTKEKFKSRQEPHLKQ